MCNYSTQRFAHTHHLYAPKPLTCQNADPRNATLCGILRCLQVWMWGVWLSGKEILPPTVWRFPWPPEISALMDTAEPPLIKLSINDLEMAGLLLHYMVLEDIADLKHKHFAAWVDNMSIVSWATCFWSRRSMVGQCLVQALSFRH